MNIIKNFTKDKSQRICNNTITSYQLTDNDVILLQQHIPFEQNEMLFIIYFNKINSKK